MVVEKAELKAAKMVDKWVCLMVDVLVERKVVQMEDRTVAQ